MIYLVYERIPLWDVQSKNYHNRDVARKLWLEIAEDLKSTRKCNFCIVILYFTLIITGVKYCVSTTLQNAD